jgi:DeoR/GlpR family transcriptional regulator of sugar metabolism
MRLVHVAAKLVAPGQALFIDGGSTNITLAGMIPINMALTVATNSIGVAAKLGGHSEVKLIVLGGVHDVALGTCTGAETLRAISQINADLYFLGSCGIDPWRGATAFNASEADVKRAMAENSAEIVVVASRDKLATAAPFRVAAPQEISHLVVDSAAPQDVLLRFEENGTRIHLAQG